MQQTSRRSFPRETAPPLKGANRGRALGHSLEDTAASRGHRSPVGALGLPAQHVSSGCSEARWSCPPGSFSRELVEKTSSLVSRLRLISSPAAGEGPPRKEHPLPPPSTGTERGPCGRGCSSTASGPAFSNKEDPRGQGSGSILLQDRACCTEDTQISVGCILSQTHSRWPFLGTEQLNCHRSHYTAFFVHTNSGYLQLKTLTSKDPSTKPRIPRKPWRPEGGSRHQWLRCNTSTNVPKPYPTAGAQRAGWGTGRWAPRAVARSAGLRVRSTRTSTPGMCGSH